MGRERLLYLDSIRGIAALIVVTSHLSFTDQALSFVDMTGLKLLRASGFAVDLFFVLSGFVLFQQVQNERPGYLTFITRRAFRLFPPCIAAVTASYAIYTLLSPAAVQSLTPWFNEVSWPQGITSDQYFMHLTLTGEDSLLRPIWSLVYEWRVSLIFPLLAAALLYAPAIVSALSIVIALFLANTTAWLDSPHRWVFYTAFYVSFFLAGAMISRYRSEIGRFLVEYPYLRYALLAIVIYYTDFRSQQQGLIGLVYVGTAATIFICLCVSDARLQELLQVRPLLFLGRISYSLYLWHMIVIGALFRLLEGASPLIVGAICIGASIIVAWAMQVLIEVPSIRFGRKVSGVAAAIWSSRAAVR